MSQPRINSYRNSHHNRRAAARDILSTFAFCVPLHCHWVPGYWNNVPYTVRTMDRSIQQHFKQFVHPSRLIKGSLIYNCHAYCVCMNSARLRYDCDFVRGKWHITLAVKYKNTMFSSTQRYIVETLLRLQFWALTCGLMRNQRTHFDNSYTKLTIFFFI